MGGGFSSMKLTKLQFRATELTRDRADWTEVEERWKILRESLQTIHVEFVPLRY